MAEGKSGRLFTAFIVILVLIIIAGGIMVWVKYIPGEQVEISLLNDNEWQGDIYIGGEVNLPGFYPFSDDDTIGTLIQAAGGITASANQSGLVLHVPAMAEGQTVQKIDINRAEVWLLEALPGIGETLARRIIDYRTQNGPFRNTKELLEVEGIGSATYKKIENLVTVAD
jgi:competence protein ComEA